MSRADAPIRSGIYFKRGQPHCRQHHKRLHPSEGVAIAERRECIRKGTHDPGLQIYPCKAATGWHLSHAGGWRSFGRLYGDPDDAELEADRRELAALQARDGGHLAPVPDLEPAEPCTRLDGTLRVTYLPDVPWGSLRVLALALAFALVAWGLGELIGIARWLVWLVSEHGRWFVPIVNGRGV